MHAIGLLLIILVVMLIIDLIASGPGKPVAPYQTEDLAPSPSTITASRIIMVAFWLMIVGIVYLLKG